MTENEVPQTETKRKEIIEKAFDLAIANCGGKGRMLVALDITESWMYALRSGRGEMTVGVALKLQVLTNGEYKWQDLSPKEYEKINAVAEYLIN